MHYNRKQKKENSLDSRNEARGPLVADPGVCYYCTVMGLLLRWYFKVMRFLLCNAVSIWCEAKHPTIEEEEGEASIESQIDSWPRLQLIVRHNRNRVHQIDETLAES